MSKTKITPTPTPGPWEFNLGGVWQTNGQTICVMYGGNDDCFYENSKANAALIAEAGTVYHETKLTPRQLLEQRDELLILCQEALRHHQGGHSEIGHKLREGIKKVTGE